MATFYKRKGKRGVRWTARVRVRGREITETFPTKGAAQSWAKAQELAIETGEFVAPTSGGIIFADLVDAFLRHRGDTRRPLGKTGSNVLLRLKQEHGLEPAAALGADFWYAHTIKRIRNGAESQTAVGDLAYAGSILAHAKRERMVQDATGPAEARRRIKEDGLRISARTRERRITDDELDALLVACDNIASSVPLGDVVRFALATAMRRGEILALRREDVHEDARVAIVRGRKHPRDQERVDEVPLMPAHPCWPLCDPLDIIKAQPKKGPLVFPYLPDTVGERFEHACSAAGLAGIVFHLLRHEALSRYAERGMDLLRLQLIGGHRDLRHVTRYAKLSARGLVMEQPRLTDSGKRPDEGSTTRRPA